MLLFALFTLAQGTSNTQQAPESGAGAALIIGTVLLIVLVLATLAAIVLRRSKASRGGVEAAPGSRETGEPPLESIDRDR